MTGPRPDPLQVDGQRAAVELVAALPHDAVTLGERVVLMALACDSYDGQTSAPGGPNLAAWTGMHLSSVNAILASLLEATGLRPALLERAATSRGGKRTRYRLRLPQPSGAVGRFHDELDDANRPGNRPGTPDGNRPGNRPASSDTPFPSIPSPSLVEPEEAAVIDPETIREERDQGSADDEHPEPFGPDHVQRIAVGNGAPESSWTPSRQERVRHLLVTKLGGPAVNLARPLLVELASSAGTIAAPVDSYVAGILRSDDASRDVERLARAGRKRMPRPVPPSPLDAMPAAVRADVLATAEAGLIDRGDVVPEWRDDAQRDYFARIIDREARQLAARQLAHRRERVSA